MLLSTIQLLIESTYLSSTTEEEFRNLKQELKDLRTFIDLYEYQKVNPTLREFLHPNSEVYLNQVKEAFPKITWEVTKGDIFFNIQKKYENAEQFNIEFECRTILTKPTWYVDASFISDLEEYSRPSFNTLDEAIEYLKAAFLKVKQSVEELI